MGAETLWGDGLVFPAPTLAAGENGALTLAAPAPTLAAGDNGMALTAPVPTLSAPDGQSSAELSIPAPTLSSTMGAPSFAMLADLFPPPPTLESEGLTGEVATFANSAPAPTLFIGTVDAVLAAPAPQLSASALSGTIITISATAPAPILDATLFSPTIITAANSAPAPQLAAALASGNILAAILAARAPRLNAQVLTGEVATALLTAATPIMAAAGYPAYTLTFANTAPAPYLDATLGTTLAATYRTWVLNTRKGALSEYDGFAFNSYTMFNGVVLAAGPAGMFSLGTQGTDAGTAITGRVKTGQDAFGSSVHKRVPRLYVGCDTAGDMLFRIITTEGGSRTYSLPDNFVRGIQQRRVPIGKGVKSRYFQFELENVAGADFSISDVLAYPTKLRRRVM